MNKLNKFGLVLLVMMLIGIFSSCSDESMDTVKQTKEETEPVEYGSEIVLGERLENPYSVKNMKKALAYLKENKPTTRTIANQVEITTTDYYVRFLVKSEKDIHRLEVDSLFLFDHPLDYEIKEDGEEYIDPAQKEKGEKWLYTSVPVDYNFPQNIEYEILENLFLIEPETEENPLTDRTLTSDFLLELEDQSLKLTGNWEDPEEEQTSNLRGRKRNPQGYVRVWDTNRNQLVGVENVRVRTRRWFSYGYAWTNDIGYYRVNRGYRNKVNYKVFFTNYTGFKIWSKTVDISPAGYYAGKHGRSGQNVNLYTNSRAWRFATVNNAVMKYRRFCTEMGISLPPSNLRIVAKSSVSSSGAPMLRRTWGLFGFTSHSELATLLFKYNGISYSANAITSIIKFSLPDLLISANSGRGTSGVYNHAFHELAHASHYTQVNNAYWVKYINYIITYGAYGNGTGKNAGVCGVGEMWGNYFGAVCMNLEYNGNNPEGFNGRESWFNPGFLSIVEQIEDMNTSIIFSCLRARVDTFNELRNELKQKTIHDEEIDNAWSEYDDWPIE